MQRPFRRSFLYSAFHINFSRRLTQARYRWCALLNTFRQGFAAATGLFFLRLAYAIIFIIYNQQKFPL